MVQQAAKYVDEIHDMALKLELIDTLRTVTDGKVSIVFAICLSGM